MTIPPGTTLHAHGALLTVGSLLGQGAEGAVYELLDGAGRPAYALKWYFHHTAVEPRRHTLIDLIDRGAPHPRFLWPLGLIEATTGEGFGYLMPLRPAGYVGVGKLLALEVPREEDKVVQLGFELAHSFLTLHARGLCYRDINFGNVFFDPSSGHALICDNDNAGIDGVSRPLVRGTPKFMAPELVRGEANPSKRTDHYSLAVLLFYVLFVGHPLEGTRTEHVLADRAAHFRFYGYEPRFCFDPDDDSNRPEPELHGHVVALWHNAPGFVRRLFVRCFTDGLSQPKARVPDSEWCDAMLRLRDSMFACDCCGLARFADPDAPDAPCVRCGHGGAPMLTLRIAHHRLVVSPYLRLTPHHLRSDFDADRVIATAERHPDNPQLIGVRNDSSEVWTFDGPGAQRGEVPPARRVGLLPGRTIRIGGRMAYVEARPKAQA